MRLRVDLGERVVPSAESVAYFVISEALTNATKHANAMRAKVTVRQIGEVLRVRVTDDGLGGADPAGSGLTGLAKRVGSLDVAFRVSSPVGGPTTVAAELPCAVIAEGSVLLRVGPSKVLEMGGFQVVAETGDGEGLLAAVAEHRPELALIDVRMPPGFTDEGGQADGSADLHRGVDQARRDAGVLRG